MNSEEILRIKLKCLAFKIYDEINAGIFSIQQETLTFENDKILEFEYTSEGAIVRKWTKEYSSESRYRFLENIFISIKETPEYISTLENIDSNAVLLNEDSLSQFVETIGRNLLNKPGTLEEKIDSLVKIFLNDIYERPFISNAVVEVIGVSVNTNEIEIELDKFQITLRQSKIDDFEKKHLFTHFNNRDSLGHFSTFSAILDIKCCDTSCHGIQPEIHKMISIMRLFRPASVDYISYTISSEEAILWHRRGGGRHGKIENSRVLKNFQLTENNLLEFTSHCKSIYQVIPKYIYQEFMNDVNNVMCSSLEVGYNHYSEALLRNLRIEEKIMNAVIGLESLLLYEKTENTLRFYLRGAKILRFFNYQPKEVKKILKTAYDVRSSFVHGNSSELEKAMNKFQGDFQDPTHSLIILLDYLRTSIVTTMFLLKNDDFVITKKNKKEFNKEKFLSIVDDSLIDPDSENQLKEILSKCHV